MGSSVGGRDLEFYVVTWKSHYVQKLGRDMKLMSRHRLVSRRVATWFLMSRPGLGLGRRNGVATPF